LCPGQDVGDADCERPVCVSGGCVAFVLEPLGSPCDDGVECSTKDYCNGSYCYGGVWVCP
jgi:hypothetical protein